VGADAGRHSAAKETLAARDLRLLFIIDGSIMRFAASTLTLMYLLWLVWLSVEGAS